MTDIAALAMDDVTDEEVKAYTARPMTGSIDPAALESGTIISIEVGTIAWQQFVKA